jgi:hypothetical protein
VYGRGAPPWTDAAEAAVVYLVLLLYIWWGQARSHAWVAVPIALVVASHVRRGETPAVLGFRRANFGRCVREVGPTLLALAAAMVLIGAACGTTALLTPRRMLAVLAFYLPWGWFQQYALNGYFVNRFAAAFRSPGRAATLGAACFAGAHFPNWFLTGVTLVAGLLAARLYLRYRNLVFLGVAHALFGTLVVLTVPTSITHGLRTGPREWRAQHEPRSPRPAWRARLGRRAAVLESIEELLERELGARERGRVLPRDGVRPTHAGGGREQGGGRHHAHADRCRRQEHGRDHGGGAAGAQSAHRGGTTQAHALAARRREVGFQPHDGALLVHGHRRGAHLGGAREREAAPPEVHPAMHGRPHAAARLPRHAIRKAALRL